MYDAIRFFKESTDLTAYDLILYPQKFNLKKSCLTCIRCVRLDNIYDIKNI